MGLSREALRSHADKAARVGGSLLFPIVLVTTGCNAEQVSRVMQFADDVVPPDGDFSGYSLRIIEGEAFTLEVCRPEGCRVDEQAVISDQRYQQACGKKGKPGIFVGSWRRVEEAHARAQMYNLPGAPVVVYDNGGYSRGHAGTTRHESTHLARRCEAKSPDAYFSEYDRQVKDSRAQWLAPDEVEAERAGKRYVQEQEELCEKRRQRLAGRLSEDDAQAVLSQPLWRRTFPKRGQIQPQAASVSRRGGIKATSVGPVNSEYSRLHPKVLIKDKYRPR